MSSSTQLSKLLHVQPLLCHNSTLLELRAPKSSQNVPSP